MADKLNAVFIFIAEGANPDSDRKIVDTPSVSLEAVGVSTYEQAAKVAKEMLEKGVGAIELCGGFGVRGTDIVARAVDYSIPVGVVRFDGHPGLGGKSGDKLF